jgi:hypothetical protein
MKELKPCPFCQTHLVHEEGKIKHIDPAGIGCVLDGQVWPDRLARKWNTRTDPPEDITGLAHELWALAQLMPEEGILDGVMRIEEALHGKLKGTKDPLIEEMAEAFEDAVHQMKQVCGDCEQWIDWVEAEQVLQKYRER